MTRMGRNCAGRQAASYPCYLCHPWFIHPWGSDAVSARNFLTTDYTDDTDGAELRRTLGGPIRVICVICGSFIRGERMLSRRRSDEARRAQAACFSSAKNRRPAEVCSALAMTTRIVFPR